MTFYFDFTNQNIVEDPYPVYRYLRENEPLHRNTSGLWVLSCYKDISEAMKDTRFSNAPSRFAVVHQRNSDKYVAADVANNIIAFLDPPRHTQERKLISAAFHQQLKNNPPDINAIATRLLEPYKKQGELELLADFATPLSVAVLAELLGIPEGDEIKLQQWSHCFFYLFMPIPSEEILNQVNIGLQEFRRYLFILLEKRKQQPKADLISALVVAKSGDFVLSDKVIIDTCMLLFSDGVENVDSGIANAILCLLQHPEQLALLRRQPDLLDNAIEECLRFNSPAQFIAKVAKDDIPLMGRTIKKDSAILLLLASANRDPNYIENPDEFNITRESISHLSLGRGRHSCIGAPLVREEMRVALTHIFQLEDLSLGQDSYQWLARAGHRWLDRLPLTFNRLIV